MMLLIDSFDGLGKARKIGESIGELVNILSNNVYYKDEDSHSPFEDRESSVEQVANHIKKMFISFREGSKSRIDHSFLTCLTGSGMGKTTFGRECYQLLKDYDFGDELLNQVMKKCNYVFIDFNSGGDKLTDADIKLERSQKECIALEKRIFSRSILKSPYKTITDDLIASDNQLFKLASFCHLKQMHNIEGDLPMTIFLHIDEFPMAHQFSVEHGSPSFLKSMLESIGTYRCNGTQQSDANRDNVFVIPRLTGTTSNGTESLVLTKWDMKHIILPPITLKSSLSIIKLKCGNPPLLRGRNISIMDDTMFQTFIRDLGVIPRSLEQVYKFLNRNKNNEMTFWQDPDTNVGELLVLLKNEVSPRLNIKYSSDVQKKLMSYCVCEANLTWNMVVTGEKTIQELVYDGHLIFVESLRLYIPIASIYSIAQSLQLFHFIKLIQFPLTTMAGSPFEEITAIMLMLRNNLCQSGDKVMINTLFNYPNSHLLLQATKPTKLKVMLVINSKFSTCNNHIPDRDLQGMLSTTLKLASFKQYREYDIVPVLISNFSISEPLLTKYQETIVIFHKDNIKHFFAGVWERVSLNGMISNPTFVAEIQNTQSLLNENQTAVQETSTKRTEPSNQTMSTRSKRTETQIEQTKKKIQKLKK